ncbi:MAG: hypothetical protein PHR06_12735 [Candidatus Cloacimonetes bacterium]|nr:hypothetical protein [Candidatus Cloacimonadota bacterium]
MLRIILLVLCGMNFQFLAAEPETERIYNELAGKLYRDINDRIPSGEVISISSIENDYNDKMYNLIAGLITVQGKFKFSDSKRHSLLHKEILKQNDPSYQEEKSPQPGKLIPAKWTIAGKMRYQHKNKYLKNYTNITLAYSVTDIEKGISSAVREISSHSVSSIPFWLFLMIFAAGLIVIAIINFLTKGYHGLVLFWIGILYSFGLLIWYLFI